MKKVEFWEKRQSTFCDSCQKYQNCKLLLKPFLHRQLVCSILIVQPLNSFNIKPQITMPESTQMWHQRLNTFLLEHNN